MRLSGQLHRRSVCHTCAVHTELCTTCLHAGQVWASVSPLCNKVGPGGVVSQLSIL
jgi:hypothetical protein